MRTRFAAFRSRVTLRLRIVSRVSFAIAQLSLRVNDRASTIAALG
jgi:hypothetical protein